MRAQLFQGCKGYKLAKALSLTAAPETGKEPSEIVQFIIVIHDIIHNIIPNYNIIPIYNPYLGDVCAGSLPVFDFSSENKVLLY